MADAHTRDLSWGVDLIWYYLHQTTKPANSVDGWHRHLDPKGALNERHRAYELLVDELDQTNPDGTNYKQSAIPWNQNNDGIVQAFREAGTPAHKCNRACGSVVKLVFRKYMNWGPGEPRSKDVGSRGFDAAKWMERSLWSLNPIRAYLPAHDHRVGVVGYRSLKYLDAKRRFEYEFLVMEPWVGGASTGTNTIEYAGTTTAFLGIMKEKGDGLTYDGMDVTTVEGHYPFS